MISDRQVKYIVVLDTYGSFVEAARVLGVTQPTLSMQLKKAEEVLGIIIFDREKSPLKVTSKGQEVVVQCRRILKELERLENVVTSENTHRGTYRIGVIATVAHYLIPLFIKSFEKKFPSVKLNFVERQTDILLKEIKEEKLDFGILATPSNDNQVYEKVLFYEGFQFYLNMAHVLLADQSINLDLIGNEVIYQLDDGHCLRFQTEQICGRLSGKLNENIFLSGGQLETLVNLTKKFGGMTLVPELFVHYLSDEDKKLIRPIAGKQLTREISLISSRFFVHEEISTILEQEIISSLPGEIRSYKKSQIKVIPIS